MDQILVALYNADILLSRISAKGDDAIALVNARQIMKAAYDQLKEMQSSEEVTDDG